MAVTLYREGKYKVHLDDGSSITVETLGHHKTGFIAPVGLDYLTTSNIHFNFGTRKVVIVEAEGEDTWQL